MRKQRLLVRKGTDPGDPGWFVSGLVSMAGTSPDHHGDCIPLDELENAARRYVSDSGAIDTNHDHQAIGRVTQSIVWTPARCKAFALPLVTQRALVGQWWLECAIHDDATAQRVQAGALTMFSLAGSAERERDPVDGTATLRNLRVTWVSVVDRGANPAAYLQSIDSTAVAARDDDDEPDTDAPVGPLAALSAQLAAIEASQAALSAHDVISKSAHVDTLTMIERLNASTAEIGALGRAIWAPRPHPSAIAKTLERPRDPLQPIDPMVDIEAAARDIRRDDLTLDERDQIDAKDPLRSQATLLARWRQRQVQAAELAKQGDPIADAVATALADVTAGRLSADERMAVRRDDAPEVQASYVADRRMRQAGKR